MFKENKSPFRQFDHLPSDKELNFAVGKINSLTRPDITIHHSTGQVTVGQNPKVFWLSLMVILCGMGLCAIIVSNATKSETILLLCLAGFVLVPMPVSFIWIYRRLNRRRGPVFILDTSERTITLCRVNKVVPAADVTAINLWYGTLFWGEGASFIAELRLLIRDENGGYQLYPLVTASSGDFRTRSIDDLATDLSQVLGVPIRRTAREGQPTCAKQHFSLWKRLFGRQRRGGQVMGK